MCLGNFQSGAVPNNGRTTVIIALGYKVGLPKLQTQSYPKNLLGFSTHPLPKKVHLNRTGIEFQI